jgi:hypothetical protein
MPGNVGLLGGDGKHKQIQVKASSSFEPRPPMSFFIQCSSNSSKGQQPADV